MSDQEHCWECRRRRLVCDGTQPVCSRCRAAGIVCPGFADEKPLRWLAPGQVKSRTRTTKDPRTANGSRNGSDSFTKPTPASDHSTPEDSADDHHMQTNELYVALPIQLRPDDCDVFEAMVYYNSHLYPDMLKHQFGPSSFVLPLSTLVNVPPSIVHTLVSFAIGHRIIRVADDPASDQLVKPMRTRLHRHLDVVLGTINKLMNNEATRHDPETAIAVYTLMFATLQQFFNSSWRTHADAFMALLQPWGTFPDVIRNSPGMELTLMALCIVAILANTTSPHNNQFHVATPAETLLLVQTYYTETYFPSFPCPKELFTEILLINDLRTHPPSPSTIHTATLLLARLESFSPEAWSAHPARCSHSQSDSTLQADWQLISSVFHASITLYAILSLQSSGAFPYSPELESSRARHVRKLFALLETAMASPRVRRRMTWPLVVAGVEAGRAGWEVQRYIAEALRRMSRELGMAPPLVARGVLERFWGRGGGGWDECFGEPLALVM